jgi:hypothetical protein
MRVVCTVLLLAVALAGCTFNDEVIGSPEMPDSYGRIDQPVLGCPDLGGLYAWPPAEGHPFGYLPNLRRDKFGSFLDLPLYREAHVWAEGPGRKAAHEFTLRTRMINRDSRVHISALTGEWSYRVFSGYSCKGGAVVIPEEELPQLNAPEWFGGKKVAAGARLARLADGSLAVGQWVRVSGRTGAVGWGNQTWFTYRIADRVYWYWTRLARVGATGAGLPPEDVAPQPGG